MVSLEMSYIKANNEIYNLANILLFPLYFISAQLHCTQQQHVYQATKMEITQEKTHRQG